LGVKAIGGNKPGKQPGEVLTEAATKLLAVLAVYRNRLVYFCHGFSAEEL
jgi:hypothetical protein